MSVHSNGFTIKSQLVGKTRYNFPDQQGKIVKGAKFFTLEQIIDGNGNGEGVLTTQTNVPYEAYDEIPLGPVEFDMQLKAGSKGETILLAVRKGVASK